MNRNLLTSSMRTMFGGMKIIVSTHGTSKKVQFRFPRCKSKRIHKKFKKCGENFRIVYSSYKFRDPYSHCEVLVIHPMVEQKLNNIKDIKNEVQHKENKKQDVITVWKPRPDFGIQIQRPESLINFNCV